MENTPSPYPPFGPISQLDLFPISPPERHPPFDCICMWNKQINSDMQTP